MCGLESNLAGISNTHDDFLSKNLQHMVFQIQYEAQELEYVFWRQKNSSFKFLPSAIWPTEPQTLLVDVISFHAALIMVESKSEWMWEISRNI